MKSIGQKIKDLMSQNKIDAPSLAKRLGKTKQAIYVMIEKDDINTSILRDLSKIFDVPISYFFSEEEPLQSEIRLLKDEILALNREIKSLKEKRMLQNNDRALDVSMKFFEAAKEMFLYYNQISTDNS